MTTQVIHATKPAKKAAKVTAPKAAVKAAPKAKAAAKPAVKRAVKAKAPAGVRCSVVNRPGSGLLLFAYTEAALQLLGMYQGAGIEKAMLIKVMGQTAISYHTTKGTLARGDDGRYSLTVAGKAFFTERATKAADADVSAWLAVLNTGKVDGRVAKNQDMLIAI